MASRPVRVEQIERSHAVRVVAAQKVDLTPVAEGYGVVQPERVWAAVAQVAGRMIETHPRLRNGEILPAGTRLFRIDPVDYERSLAQAQAQLAEHDVGAANARSSLALQRRDFDLAKREMERIRTCPVAVLRSRFWIRSTVPACWQSRFTTLGMSACAPSRLAEVLSRS